MRWTLSWQQWVAFGSVLLLLVGVTALAVAYLSDALTHEVLTDREELAELGAVLLNERLDRLSDIAVSFATRQRFREHVAAGAWEAAVQILAPVPEDFPVVERLFITDADGVLRADVPALPDVRGQDFSVRDWYRGIAAGGRAYVSDVYIRAAEPRIAVIAVAAPVHDLTDTSVVRGYLVLQIPLDRLFAWSKEVNVGEDGYMVFTDRAGTIAAHPRLDLRASLTDFSEIPWVAKARAGETGVGIEESPALREERIVAYAPVPNYGWSVGVSQGAAAAFRGRDGALRDAGMLFGAITLLAVYFAVVLVRGFVRLQYAKDEFLSVATHQLKTPLAGLRWTMESLRIPPDILDPKQRSYLGNLQGFTDRMAQSVDDLLGVSRIELGRIPLELAAEDLRELLGGLMTDIGRYASVSQRQVSLRIAPDVPATVVMDRKLVYHALQNLISNAIEYSTEGTPILLECTRRDGALRLSVENEGEPIPSDVQQRLFTKFYRAPSARDRKANGTGIGLYIVRTYAERWGGRAGIESRGRQTVFWITIPVPANH